MWERSLIAMGSGSGLGGLSRSGTAPTGWDGVAPATGVGAILDRDGGLVRDWVVYRGRGPLPQDGMEWHRLPVWERSLIAMGSGSGWVVYRGRGPLPQGKKVRHRLPVWERSLIAMGVWFGLGGLSRSGTAPTGAGAVAPASGVGAILDRDGGWFGAGWYVAVGDRSHRMGWGGAGYWCGPELAFSEQIG